MEIKVADIIKDAAYELNDPYFNVISKGEWFHILKTQQHLTYPRIFRRNVLTLNTTDDREYDLSSADPDIREIEEVLLYQDSNDKEPTRIDNWYFDEAQNKLRLYYSVGSGQLLKIIYKSNLSTITKETNTLNIDDEIVPILKYICVRDALQKILNDRLKLNAFRTTIDDQASPYMIQSVITSYDRKIELELRDKKKLLSPGIVKKSYKEVIDPDNPQYWITHGL